MRFAPSERMPPAVRLESLSASPSEDRADSATSGSSALELDPGAPVLLRFTISARDPAALEALRYARRSMLREEWTLGRSEDESSLQDAVFTATEVIWQVRRGEREACLRKLEDLVSRANRVAGDA